MIKLLLGGDGNSDKVMVFGLVPKNLDRLQEGKPILIDLDELGVSGIKIVITYGESQAAILKDVRDNLGVNVPVDAREPEPNETIFMRPGAAGRLYREIYDQPPPQ